MGWSWVTEHSSCRSLGWIRPIPGRVPTEFSPKFAFFLFALRPQRALATNPPLSGTGSV